MKIDGLKNAEWLEWFNEDTSYYGSSDLYNTLCFDEEIKEFCGKFSDFYYIVCSPFDREIEEWIDYPEIYSILKKCQHMAEDQPLEILIGKFNEDSMKAARIMTEKRRKESEWSGVIIWDPASYNYLVWYFWGSGWRWAQDIIHRIKKMFPEKVKELKHE